MDIKWYEWLYQISDRWRVKALPRTRYCRWWEYITKTRILKIKINKVYKNKSWGNVVRLYLGDWGKTHHIARLVWTHFMDNPLKYREVHHIDWNSNNNNVDNLRWTNQKYF